MSIELKRQIRAHIKDVISKFYDREQEYRVSLVLKDNAVAIGTHFNPLIAKDKALDTAVQYGLKQGWIKEVSLYFSFSKALDLLKQGQKITRKGWNGKGMWIIYTPGRVVENLEPNSFYDKCGFEAPVTITGHIDMKAADGSMVVGWLASQTDLFADDWMISA